jgi:hypothetical protein
MKCCTGCGQTKPLTEFSTRRPARCRACVKVARAAEHVRHRDEKNAKSRQYHAEHKAENNARSRRYQKENNVALAEKKRDYTAKTTDQRKDAQLRRYYGISLVEYRLLFDLQGGICANCLLPEAVIDSRTGKVRSLATDHEHVTGAVRGLLCSRCNPPLSTHFGTVERLRNASAFLRGGFVAVKLAVALDSLRIV